MSQYEKRGVSAHKPDVHEALKAIDQGLYPNAFCKLIADPFALDPEYCVALHADGAGTKSAVAYLHYLEFGDPIVFRGIAQDSIVMNLDDLLCVGATGNFIFSNTIGRNAKIIPGDIIREIIVGYEEFAQRMSALGVNIISCGGETADLGDLVRTVIVDSTLAARIPRRDVIDCANVRAGQVIVGLASFGQATYEDAENSGIGTNGFTTARHVLLSKAYKDLAPETFAPEIGSLVYQGRYKLGDILAGNMTIGAALLSPTRTYAPIICSVLNTVRPNVSAIFHNSGGGLSKCVRFGKQIHYIKDNLFPTPPILSLIRTEGSISFTEMCCTFNMGHRLELVCDESAVDVILAIAENFGVPGRVIGSVEFTQGPNRLTILHADDSCELKYGE